MNPRPPVPQSTLSLRNRQHLQPLELRLLRRIVRAALQHAGAHAFHLAVYCLGAPEMTRLNQTFLRHRGSTDVITFDYSEPARPDLLHGEIFVCLDEAIRQARRFGTSWQSELVRYVVHGILHLQGFDDARPRQRRLMKREEASRLRHLATRFDLQQLSAPRLHRHSAR